MNENVVRLVELLPESSINLHATATDRDGAVRQAGQALVEVGAIDPSYITTMLDRERSVSTYIGEGIAIPHGTLAGKAAVKSDALVLLRFPENIDWNGASVTVVIGMAAKGAGHIALLSQLALVLLVPGNADALRNASSPAQVRSILSTATTHQE